LDTIAIDVICDISDELGEEGRLKQLVECNKLQADQAVCLNGWGRGPLGTLPCAVSSIEVSCSDGIAMFGKELARGNEKGTPETRVDTQKSPVTATKNDSMLTRRYGVRRPKGLLDKIMWGRVESFVGRDREKELETRLG
jgi:hypothetical protein